MVSGHVRKRHGRQESNWRPIAVIGLLVVAQVAAALMLTGRALGAAAPDRTRPVTLVVGDSITARYNDIAGDPLQGWWSYLGRELNTRVLTAAQSGTGVIARGGSASCKLKDRNPLTTVGYRLKRAVRSVRPDTLIVASGANDWRKCNKKTGKAVRVPIAERARKIKAFFKLTAQVTKANGVPASRVLVLSPRGTKWAGRRNNTAKLYKRYAIHYGFTYIEVGQLSRSLTVDGTHPNLSGNRALAARVSAALTPARKLALSRAISR